MRSRFDEQLALLNKELIEMGALCEEVIALAAQSLAEGSAALARRVAPLDAEIDRKEREIESLCLKLLLQQQPVACDLRQISAALKMITDMERIGDQAEDIAEIVVFLDGRGAESSVSVPPVFIGYMLQFLATLLPTLIIEGVLLLIFQYSWKQNWKAFLLVNLATQGLLALFSTILTLGSGPTLFAYVFYLLPAELVVLLVEIYLYAGRRLLKGQSSKCAAVYAIFANLSSAILGYCIAEPVWRFVVSLS